MPNPTTKDRVLFFQLRRFQSLYKAYDYLYAINSKYFLRNYVAKESLEVVLLAELCFLFDENNPDSISSYVFETNEGIDLQKDLIREWNYVKEEVSEIVENTGFLTPTTELDYRSGSCMLRKLSKMAFNLMARMDEMRKLLDINVTDYLD